MIQAKQDLEQELDQKHSNLEGEKSTLVDELALL
jgi:hypothetical protein